MADFVLNGTTYSGSPTNPANPQRPAMPVERTVKKIGRLIEAADGSTSFVYRGLKRTWKLTWPKANSVTQQAVLALRALTTTFTLVDVSGVSFTVLTAGEDEHIEAIQTDKANTYLYDLVLIMREA